MNNPNSFQVEVNSLTNVSVSPGQGYSQTFTQGVQQSPSHTSSMSVMSHAPRPMFGPPGGFMMPQPPGMMYGPPPRAPFGAPPPPPPLPGQFGPPPFGPPQQFPPFARPPPERFRRSYRDLRPEPRRGRDDRDGRRPPPPGRDGSRERRGDEDDDDDDAGTASRRRRRGGGRRSRRREDEEGEDNEEADRHAPSCPVSKASRERARRDEEEDEDETDRPGRRRKKYALGSSDSMKRYITVVQRVYSDKGEDKPSKDKMVDQGTLDKLEAGFKKLQAANDCKSLLKKYLNKDVFDKLKNRKTAMGATLLDVIQSGVENLDSGVGLYAPDAESYTLFAELFNPVIEDYHGGFKSTDKHPPTDFGDLNTLVNLDPENKFVVSTRVRCGRSLQGYPFNPCLTEAQYKEMEEKVSSALRGMDGELKGTYYPLTGMDKKTQQQLIDDHFLFKEGDRFLQAANACRYWPTGRGIFHNDNKTFLVWCNEEDHLRIISMQQGGDLKQVFSRMVNGVKEIEKKLPFSRDDRLGFLTFCPTNLGTTIRASVHIKLPKLAADKAKLDSIAAKYNLQVRGTRGEHTESEGGVYDISNKRRMGLTEYQAVKEMQDGIQELIKLEQAA
nr:arginine kinase isoform X2 [Dermacentor andersoni]